MKCVEYSVECRNQVPAEDCDEEKSGMETISISTHVTTSVDGVVFTEFCLDGNQIFSGDYSPFSVLEEGDFYQAMECIDRIIYESENWLYTSIHFYKTENSYIVADSISKSIRSFDTLDEIRAAVTSGTLVFH